MMMNLQLEALFGYTYYQFSVKLLINLVLTVFAGAMSGLTVGYLSIDDLVLELKTTTGTEVEKEHAAILIPLLSKKHWLLVTLLVSNAFAMESLPLCLGNKFI